MPEITVCPPKLVLETSDCIPLRALFGANGISSNRSAPFKKEPFKHQSNTSNEHIKKLNLSSGVYIMADKEFTLSFDKNNFTFEDKSNVKYIGKSGKCILKRIKNHFDELGNPINKNGAISGHKGPGKGLQNWREEIEKNIDLDKNDKLENSHKVKSHMLNNFFIMYLTFKDPKQKYWVEGLEILLLEAFKNQNHGKLPLGNTLDN